jgi:Spy/CpxP family protein refolding chaperone
MKHVNILIAAVALLAVAVAVRAEEKPARKGAGAGGQRPGMMEHLLPPMAQEKLNLTADQKTKVEELDAAFGKEVKAFWASHAELREKMKAAREAGDKDKMKDLMAEMKPMMEARKSGMEKVKALLTDEQKKTLEEMAEKMRAGRPGGHKPGGEKPKE